MKISFVNESKQFRFYTLQSKYFQKIFSETNCLMQIYLKYLYFDYYNFRQDMQLCVYRRTYSQKNFTGCYVQTLRSKNN